MSPRVFPQVSQTSCFTQWTNSPFTARPHMFVSCFGRVSASVTRFRHRWCSHSTFRKCRVQDITRHLRSTAIAQAPKARWRRLPTFGARLAPVEQGTTLVRRRAFGGLFARVTAKIRTDDEIRAIVTRRYVLIVSTGQPTPPCSRLCDAVIQRSRSVRQPWRAWRQRRSN